MHDLLSYTYGHVSYPIVCTESRQKHSKKPNVKDVPAAGTGWSTAPLLEDSDANCRLWANSMLACAGARGSKESLVRVSSS